MSKAAKPWCAPSPVSGWPSLPPGRRSRVALRLTAAAAVGRFELQHCVRCSAVQYPPREACHRCLSDELEWTLQSGAGRLLSQTTLLHSHEAYFRARLPWRVGLVRLDCGPTVVAHLHQSVTEAPCAVRVAVRLDNSGQAVLIAVAPTENVVMNDDPKIREMSSDPRGCRILVTDATTMLGRLLVRELIAAGAKHVWAGTPPGRTLDEGTHGSALPVSLVSLDVRDAESVRRAAESLGSSVDILINNADGGGPTATARDQMEVNYFGLLGLWDRFGPSLLEPRAAPGGARAWVNMLTLDALCNLPSQTTFSASMAAASSLSQGIRTRSRPAGVRVVNVFAGPTSPETLARSVIRALVDGLEDVYPGDVAQEWLARWLQSPKVLEREVGQHV